MVDVGTIVAGTVTLSGLALYVIRSELRGDVTRLDGRIDTHEAACEERQKRMDERHEAMEKKLDGMDAKLDRLMERV